MSEQISSRLAPADIESFLRYVLAIETMMLEMEALARMVLDSKKDLQALPPIKEPSKDEVIRSRFWPWFATIAALVGACIGFTWEYRLDGGDATGAMVILLGVALVLCASFGVFVGGVFGAFLGFLADAFRAHCEQRAISQHFEKVYRSYEIERDSRNAAIARLDKEYDISLDRLKHLSNLLENAKGELSSMEILLAPYWNLPAICQLLQHFESDRSTSLGDAYNRYEEELRFNSLVSNVSIVAERPDGIGCRQWRLAQAVEKIQGMLGEIPCSLSQCVQSLDNVKAGNILEKTCFQLAIAANALMKDKPTLIDDGHDAILVFPNGSLNRATIAND